MFEHTKKFWKFWIPNELRLCEVTPYISLGFNTSIDLIVIAIRNI
jgi:hypothetical protein